MSQILNTCLKTDKPHRLNDLANLCLAPYRHCFGGRHVEVVNSEVTVYWDLPLQSHTRCLRSFLKTAAAIALLIPGYILGAVARHLSLRDSDLKAAMTIGCAYEPKAIPDLWTRPEQTSLEQLKNSRHKNFESIVQILQWLRTGPDIWKDPVFLKAADEMFTHLFHEMNHLLANAQRRANSPEALSKLLSDQGRKSPNFYNRFFQRSFVQLYHIARQNMWMDNTCNNLFHPTFAQIDQMPYFTRGTPQHTWRKMYNDLCQHFNTLTPPGLERHRNWTQPDLAPFAAPVQPHIPA